MKKVRNNSWYLSLIENIGNNIITNKEFWELAEKADIEVGLGKGGVPTGSRGAIIQNLINTGLVEVARENKLKYLISIKDYPGLVRFFGGKFTEKVEEPIVSKPSKPEINPDREAFIKIFKCLRCAARSKKAVLELDMCKKVNKLKRINSKHVLFWARKVVDLGIPITLPVIRKSESGEVFVEFKNYEEDLYKICLYGQENYPEVKHFSPDEAFGDHVRVQQIKSKLDSKKKDVVAEKSVTAPKGIIPDEGERNRVIFLIAGKICEQGDYVILGDTVDYLAKNGIHFSKGEVASIVCSCPDLNLVMSTEKIYLRPLQKGETIKKFWDMMRDSYGPKTDEKEEILCRISMTKGEVTEYLSSKTVEVSIVSRITEHDNIFRINVAKHSAVDKLNMLSLIRRFRREDIVLTRSAYTESLYKELKEREKSYKMDNDLYRFETGFFK